MVRNFKCKFWAKGGTKEVRILTTLYNYALR
jgi:hypothetical protein